MAKTTGKETQAVTVVATVTTAQPAPAVGLDTVIADLLTGLTSPHTRRSYENGLKEFRTWWDGGGKVYSLNSKVDRAAMVQWKKHLQDTGKSASTVNVRMAALKFLLKEMADRGMLDYSSDVASVVSVKGARERGTKRGRWLSTVQAQALLDAPGTSTLHGLRNTAIIALMLGAGLRRSEVAALTNGHLRQLGERWALVDIMGKGLKVGTVPLAQWTVDAVRGWQGQRLRLEMKINQWTHGNNPLKEIRVTVDTALFTPLPPVVGRGACVFGHRYITSPMSVEAIWKVIRKYGAVIGVPDLTPHDIRRTFAELANAGGADLKQTQLSMRHSNISTTSKYLSKEQNLVTAPCDYIGLRFVAHGKEGHGHTYAAGEVETAEESADDE